MNESQRIPDPWALPTLALWIVFLIVGLFPDRVFVLMRNLGGVVTMDAYVNSPYVITIAFTVYLAVFVFLRCKEGGHTDAQAQGRAVQAGLVAVIAFLWQPLGLLAVSDEIYAPRLELLVFKFLIYTTVFLKMLSWLYLLSLFVRYYAFGNRCVFADMPCVFPSAHVPPPSEREGGEDWEPSSGKEPD